MNILKKIGKKSKKQDPDVNIVSDEKNEHKSTSLKLLMKKQFKENLLLILTIIAVILAVVIGFLVRSYTNLTPPQKAYFGFPGEIFLRMLKFITLPLISSSVITGIASLGGKKAGKIASRAFTYYFTTTFSAVCLGIILVIIIKPGLRNQEKVYGKNPIGGTISPIDTVLDLIRNIFPDNIIQMTFSQYESEVTPHYVNVSVKNMNNNMNSSLDNSSMLSMFDNMSNITNYESKIDYYMTTGRDRNGINVLGLVMFCFVMGYVITVMGEQGKLLYDLFEAINFAFIKIIGFVMLLSPFGILSLICVAILKMEDPAAVFQRISYYLLTVLLGLSIHGLIVLPVLYVIFTRKNIFIYAKNMLEAMLIAFATSSSNATLPANFRCVEEKNKIPKSVSRFVLPVGATVNMDGTALYEAAGALFIAQMNGLDLKVSDYIITSVTATLASIGAAGVPSAGLITMVIVLSALNLPQDQISLIFAVDWFLDRFRTMINVWGDAVGAGIVAHLCRKEVYGEDELTDSKADEEAPIEKNAEFPTVPSSSQILKINEVYDNDTFDKETSF